MSSLGRHTLVELYDCEPARLQDLDGVERALLGAARAAGATIRESRFHRFDPQGISGFVVLAESHLSIHCWPEHGYAAVDLFTCGPRMHPERATELLAGAFVAGRMEIRELLRGEALGRETPDEVAAREGT